MFHNIHNILNTCHYKTPTMTKSQPEKASMVAVTPEACAALGMKRDSQVLTKHNPTIAAPRSSFIKGNSNKNRVQYQGKGKSDYLCFQKCPESIYAHHMGMIRRFCGKYQEYRLIFEICTSDHHLFPSFVIFSQQTSR